MAILGLTTTRVPIPHEDGEWMELRDSIPPFLVGKAQDAQTRRQMEIAGEAVKNLGWEAVQAIQERQAPAPSPQPGKDDAGKSPSPDDFDLDMLALYMIEAWSYRTSDGKRIKVSRPHIEALDRKTRDWVHEQVWERAKPTTEEDIEGN